MNIIMNIFRGMVMGIANVIPGVSGGTMAVSLGIYDKLISSVSGLFKHFKDSILFLVQIFAGMAIGIICFTYLIEFLFGNYPLPTALAFIGLIMGGVPVIYQALKKDLVKTHKKIGMGHIVAFVALFAMAIALPLMGTGVAADLSKVSVGTMVVLFFVGVIASATMVVPGVSGSMVLLILGYYTSIISEITNFLDALRAFDMAGMVHGFMVLCPFGVGVIVGIFLIAKAIEWLFANYCSHTYSAILGLIVASPFAIFINQAQSGNLEVTLGRGVIGVILLVVCAGVTYMMGKMNKE